MSAGLLEAPVGAKACYVFAHGAGAGMHHFFMAALAGKLAQRGIATLRFNFPFMEQGSKRPDPPAVAHAAIRAAVAEAAQRLPGVALFAGGKSFGGRRATLHVVEGADHAFHVLVRSGRTGAQVLDELADTLAWWMTK